MRKVGPGRQLGRPRGSASVGYLLAKGLLALGSAALAVGLAEGALRMATDLPTTHHRLFCEYDPLLGWRKIPGASGWHVTSEYKVLEEFNSRGLRGPEYDYEKPPGTFRVLVLGDSFVEGYAVPFEEVHTERLRRLLSQRGLGPVEVINAGTGGYTTDQELLFFETEGVRYGPDLTIVLFYENDPLYNTQGHYFRGNKPHFVLEEDGDLRLTNVPPPPPRVSGVRRGADWLLDNFRVARLAGLAIRSEPRLHSLAARAGLTEAPPEAESRVPFESLVYLRPEPRPVEHAWRVTEALLARLRERTEAAGGSLLFMYAPGKQVIHGDICGSLGRRYGVAREECSADLLARRLEEICRRNGIDFLDPVPVFRRRAAALEAEGKRLYYGQDSHWNREGNRLVADLLAERILERRRPLAFSDDV